MIYAILIIIIATVFINFHKDKSIESALRKKKGDEISLLIGFVLIVIWWCFGFFLADGSAWGKLLFLAVIVLLFAILILASRLFHSVLLFLMISRNNIDRENTEALKWALSNRKLLLLYAKISGYKRREIVVDFLSNAAIALKSENNNAKSGTQA